MMLLETISDGQHSYRNTGVSMVGLGLCTRGLWVKAAVLLVFDVSSPEELPVILDKMDPTELPRFTGNLRIFFEPYITVLVDFLDD